MSQLKFRIVISPKGMNPIDQKFVIAKDAKEAESKGQEFIKAYKTHDKALKECIADCGGLEAVITELN